ncbi:hypothetical protein O181_132505, partial [Austropuccinia psidii MF-1]|nr:hypothetical protein [Austropuccinia psidii MF-1]
IEADIPSNQMDLDREEVRPEQGLPSLPQERHIWRIPELPTIPQGLYQQTLIPNTKIGSEQQRKRSGKYAKPLAGGYELLLTHQELSGSGEDHRILRRVGPFSCKERVKKIKNWLKDPSLLSTDQKKELEMTRALKEGLVASTSSKPAAEASKEKPKGPQKKKKGPKSHQGKGKGK